MRARKAKALVVKMYRTCCEILIRQAARFAGITREFQTPVLVSFDYYLYRPTPEKDPKAYRLTYDRYYPRDEQNGHGGAKAPQDALQDAGLIPGDSAKFVRSGPCRLYSRAKEHQGRAALVLTIEEVTE
jgi:hypothetical protein